jgi:hypothetical protein
MRGVGLLMCVLLVGHVSAGDGPQIIDVLAGQQADIFFQINTTGRLYIKIVAAQGESCANLWWIKWPLGDVEQLGRKCGNTTIDIPTGTHGAIAAKLRAGGISQHTKIVLFSDE